MRQISGYSAVGILSTLLPGIPKELPNLPRATVFGAVVAGEPQGGFNNIAAVQEKVTGTSC